LKRKALLPSYPKRRKAESGIFEITTADGVEMDGWMAKPADFDPGKKYPVVFYVYSEPASATFWTPTVPEKTVVPRRYGCRWIHLCIA
jgi:dipeptidyl aminopeptidase/acylaminoacyl peptidase